MALWPSHSEDVPSRECRWRQLPLALRADLEAGPLLAPSPVLSSVRSTPAPILLCWSHLSICPVVPLATHTWSLEVGLSLQRPQLCSQASRERLSPPPQTGT